MGAFADKVIVSTEEMVGSAHATKSDTLNRHALVSLGNTGDLISLPGALVRPTFAWKDADEIYIGSGAYHLQGTDEIIVYWDSQLTFQIAGAGASECRYVYIDNSAVQSGASRLLTASEFTHTTSAPTYSESKHGFYNGLDRCIFGIRTDGSGNILEFHHTGNLVKYATLINSFASANPDQTFVDEVTLAVPAFCREVLTTFEWVYGNGNAYLAYRTEGQTDGTGHNVLYVTAASTIGMTTIPVICSSNLKIDIKEVAAVTTNQAAVYTAGWFLPNGM